MVPELYVQTLGPAASTDVKVHGVGLICTSLHPAQSRESKGQRNPRQWLSHTDYRCLYMRLLVHTSIHVTGGGKYVPALYALMMGPRPPPPAPAPRGPPGGGDVHNSPLYNVAQSRESKGSSAMVITCCLAVFACSFYCTHACRHI